MHSKCNGGFFWYCGDAIEAPRYRSVKMKRAPQAAKQTRLFDTKNLFLKAAAAPIAPDYACLYMNSSRVHGGGRVGNLSRV